MESDSAIRHAAFFEALATMKDSDPGWRLVSAGLVVMRFVDRWISEGSSTVEDSWGMTAVAEAIAEIPETTPVRRILGGIVDAMSASTAVDLHAINPRLMAYGQALEYEARWSLAADVYQTIVAHADPIEDADLVVSAYIQLAFCLRTLADLDGAAVAYAEASRIALSAGDLIGVLRGRLGDVKIAVARGNMPHAEVILEETIARADASGLDDIRSRALHERAYVAGLRGQHERAVEYAYQALEIATTPRDRDRILFNIASGLRYLGLANSARDAFLVLAATAQEQYTRWTSELHLMELAAEGQHELQFDKYRRDLEKADFTPLLRVRYLLYVGRGYHSLNNPDTGIPYLERAVEVAAEHQLNQLMFEAEIALMEARKRSARVASQPASDAPSDVPSNVQAAIEGIQQLKDAVGVA